MEAMAGTHRLGTTPGSRRLLRTAPDERLVELVRDGSEAAFEAVYDRHHRGILAFCRHMLGSRHEAEDALQHTFLSAYGDLVASDKPIQLKAWLYTIARNRCLSMLRARRERPVEDLDAAEHAIDGLAVQVQTRQDLRELLGDLRSLPEQQRAALVLAEIGDLPHTDIAAILDVRKEKVKALVFQARESLAASRQARATPCVEIREQLATMSGGALRRAPLRRHLRDCAGCRAFRKEVKRQRAAMAVVLPVLPSAGLKAASMPWTAGTATAATAAAGSAAAGGTATLGAAGGAAAGGAAAGGAAAGTSAAGGVGALLSGTAAKVLVVATVAGTAAGGAAGVETLRSPGDPGSKQSAVPADGPSESASATAKASTPPRSEKAQGVLPERRAGKGGNSELARERRAERRRAKRERAERGRAKRERGGTGAAGRTKKAGGGKGSPRDGARTEPKGEKGRGNAGGNGKGNGRIENGGGGQGNGNGGRNVAPELETPVAPQAAPVVPKARAPKDAGTAGG